MQMSNQRGLAKMIVVFALAVGMTGTAAQTAAPTEPRRVLELPAGPGNPRNSEGDMIALKDGSILLVYSHFIEGTGNDDDPALIASRVSRDGGLTWSATSVPIASNEAEGARNLMSVSLLRLSGDRIALFYLRLDVANPDGDSRPVMRISTDEGATWSAPRFCVPDAEKGYYVLNNGRALRLASGRLVLPMALHTAPGSVVFDGAAWLVCYVSDDEGATWRRANEPFASYDKAGRRVTTQEPGVVELKDGRVMMYARTMHGQQWVCYSSDGCATWTKAVPSNIFSPCSPATIMRLSNGDLVMAWNDHEGHDWTCGNRPLSAAYGSRRVPLTVAVSRNEGRTWRPRKVLEGHAMGWYCYVAIREHQGNLLLQYCAENNLQDSRVTLVPLAWLYAPCPDPAPLVETGPGAFEGLETGPFTTLATPLGVWTAAEGHAELATYEHGTGVRILGGETEHAVTLALAQPLTLAQVKLYAERWTARAPYTLTVEAKRGDGAWTTVLQEGASTPVGNLRPLALAGLDGTVEALRFRCTSVLGVIVCDHASLPVDFRGFFND